MLTIVALVLSVVALNRGVDTVASAAPRDGSVGTAALQEGAVTAGKLAQGAVTPPRSPGARSPSRRSARTAAEPPASA